MMKITIPLAMGMLSAAANGAPLYKSAADRVPRGLAKFGTDSWPPEYGTHRAVVEVKAAADAVLAYLPWRRHDPHPETKNVLVVAAQSGKTAANRVIVTCNREYAEIAFQPIAGPGRYYLYYLQPVPDANAFRWPRWAFPITRYVAPQQTADPAWLARHHLAPVDLETLPLRTSPAGNAVLPGRWRNLPPAELIEFQALRDPSGEHWNSFYPMEVIATLDERLALERRCRFRPFILFPENRRNPIRMTDALPYCWAIRDKAALDAFADSAKRNEYYVFQIGVYAFRNLLPHLRADWSDLRSKSGAVIPKTRLTCFNLAGVDQFGKPFSKTLHVERGRVQALWFGVDIPESIAPGVYEGVVTVSCDDLPSQSVRLRLNVVDEVLPDRGDGDSRRLSRLRWLNSRIGLDEEACAPFTPVEIEGRRIMILGRSITLGENGLPEAAVSRIDMFRADAPARPVLESPVTFELVRSGESVRLAQNGLECVHRAPGLVRFRSVAAGGGLSLRIETTVEMDGFIGGRVRVESTRDIAMDTVRLTVPVSASVARFILGTGATQPLVSRCPERGGTSAESFRMTWLGCYNAGLALRLPKERAAWVNQGRGRFRLERRGNAVRLILESGRIPFSAGQPRSLDFELYVTPFKPLPKRHWDWRYDHAAYGNTLDVDRGLKIGAKVFTVHHGCSLYPYISYPFLVAPALRRVVDKVHAAGGLFKAYYTIRELSNRAPELWALRSLGDEILPSAPGRLGYEELSELPLEYQLRNPHDHPLTGQAWMCEHLISDYHTRWHAVIDGNRGFQDGSLQISGASRWSNFYLEGLDWLMVHAGLDGLYLDGITFDRESFKRVRKVLVRRKPEGLIDYHGDPAGVLPQLPYIDSLWFGEGADYNRDPDYWLIAVSGIPFGVPGELLKREASVQRGMVYGLCQRYGWMGGVDPAGLWSWWDAFDIQRAEMIGYWMPHCPVRVANSALRATAYVHRGKRTAVAIASWADAPVLAEVEFDFEALGLSPDRVTLHAPAIPGFQPEGRFRLGAPLPIAPNGGMILVLAKKKETP